MEREMERKGGRENRDRKRERQGDTEMQTVRERCDA